MIKRQLIYTPNREVLSRQLIDYIDKRFSKLAPKEYIVSELKKDFKEEEAFVFTKEELNKYTKNVIEESLKIASEKQEQKTSVDWEYLEVKKSIINSFDKIFTKFKI